MSLLSKAVKSVTSQPLNVVKKAVQVNVAGAVGVATGFVTGGVPGAIAGGVAAGGNALQAVSKEGSTSNSRLLKESLGFGAAGGAVGQIASKANVLTAFSKPASGMGNPLTGAIQKITNFGQSGGLVGNAGNVFKSIGGLAGKGIPVLSGIFKTGGTVPGTDETVSTVTADQNSLTQQIRRGFGRIKTNVSSEPPIGQQPSSAPVIVNNPPPQTSGDAIGQWALGNSVSAVSDIAKQLIKKTTGKSSKSDPVVIPAPAAAPSPIFFPTGEGGSASTNLLIYGAIALAVFLFIKTGR